MFRRDRCSTVNTPVVPARPSKEELDNPSHHCLNNEQEGVGSVSQRLSVMGVMQKVNPFKSTSQTSSAVSKASSADSLEQENEPQSVQKPGMLKGVMQKVNPFKSTSQAPSTVSKASSSESLEQGKPLNSSQNPGVKGVFQKMNPFKSMSQVTPTINKGPSSESLESESTPDLEQITKQDAHTNVMGGEEQAFGKQNPWGFRGVMQKVNPFKSSSQAEDTRSQHSNLSSSTGSLADNNNSTEKNEKSVETDTGSSIAKQNPVTFKGMIQKVNPFKSSTQAKPVNNKMSSSSSSLDDGITDKHIVQYSEVDGSSEVKSYTKEAPKTRTRTFRIRRILPSALFGTGTKSSNPDSSDEQPLAQEEEVEVRTLEMAEVPVPSEGISTDPLEDEDGLLSWWKTVEGWEEWNEATQENDSMEIVEEAADRVYMAARLFVRLFNQHGASLQQRILELLAVADAADIFHKKTVTASVGGGVASVAGSVTTITGLILAPFTMGTSLIVTAVGIGVATAGGVASASANITDTVHSKTDRKKVEKMIQGYQEEMKDIKECLDFLQEGMETLEEWNFEAYAESISKKHLNQNMKHVMKEGGRAGKALLINTESLISTVQVLSVAGSAAKAAQVMSVTTGVMSGLFLALDVFFLAKDSLELKKGAKTEFAAKIREVCKDLQTGLLELNRIKEELQRTMDGIEIEVEDEEEDEEDEDALESDPKKLAQLEE